MVILRITVQEAFEYPARSAYTMPPFATRSTKITKCIMERRRAVMVRDAKAWQFKEVGAEQGEWEVYARKDEFLQGNRHCADGQCNEAGRHQHQCNGGGGVYTASLRGGGIHRQCRAALDAAVKDFIDLYGDSDAKALADNLKTLKPYAPAARRDGLDATIMAIKANEAVVQQQKITMEKELFDI